MGPPSISIVYTPESHLSEQCPECAATPMASTARTVQADDIWKNKISPSGCFFIATKASSYCVLMKDCKLSFFKSALNFSLKSKTASSASRTLKYSQIIHGDLPSRERAFLFLWIFCYKKKLFSWSVRWWCTQSHSLSYSREPRNVPAILFRWLYLISSARHWTSRTSSRWSKSLLLSDDLHLKTLHF